jgi:hypothetical protein
MRNFTFAGRDWLILFFCFFIVILGITLIIKFIIIQTIIDISKNKLSYVSISDINFSSSSNEYKSMDVVYLMLSKKGNNVKEIMSPSTVLNEDSAIEKYSEYVFINTDYQSRVYFTEIVNTEQIVPQWKNSNTLISPHYFILKNNPELEENYNRLLTNLEHRIERKQCIFYCTSCSYTKRYNTFTFKNSETLNEILKSSKNCNLTVTFDSIRQIYRNLDKLYEMIGRVKKASCIREYTF